MLISDTTPRWRTKITSIKNNKSSGRRILNNSRMTYRTLRWLSRTCHNTTRMKLNFEIGRSRTSSRWMWMSNKSPSNNNKTSSNSLSTRSIISPPKSIIFVYNTKKGTNLDHWSTWKRTQIEGSGTQLNHVET